MWNCHHGLTSRFSMVFGYLPAEPVHSLTMRALRPGRVARRTPDRAGVLGTKQAHRYSTAGGSGRTLPPEGDSWCRTGHNGPLTLPSLSYRDSVTFLSTTFESQSEYRIRLQSKAQARRNVARATQRGASGKRGCRRGRLARFLSPRRRSPIFLVPVPGPFHRRRGHLCVRETGHAD